jgi:hypothetical protein
MRSNLSRWESSVSIVAILCWMKYHQSIYIVLTNEWSVVCRSISSLIGVSLQGHELCADHP